jgi:hypothetical protein
MRYSSKQFDIMWKHFLAYQAQFHARDFILLNPRDNKARFIKLIRLLVNHQSFSNLGIDIDLLVQPSSSKGITNSSTLAQMQKLCELLEGSEAFTLKEINADENAAIMSFKEFNAAQWTAHIESSKLSKKHGGHASPKEKRPDEEQLASPRKNTRRRIDPLSALALDVDLQLQSDTQNSFQLQSLQSSEYQNEHQLETNTSTPKSQSISFDAFWDILVKDKSLHPLQITQDDLRYQWCHWSGGHNSCRYDGQHKDKPKRALVDGDIQFTRDAALELFKWRHLFQAGIDIHHLPAGFSLTKSKGPRDEDIYLLNFLPKLKEIAEPDKLAIQCQAPLTFPAGTKSRLTLDDVKDLFKEYSNVNEDSIKHLYEHALKYFPDKGTLQQNKEYMQSIQIVLNLTPSQRTWWEQLFEQHTKNCGQDDLPSLVASFQEFLDQITHYHQYFDFYPPKFSNIKSMPMALTQMIALLDKCKNEDRPIQWNCITELHLTGYEVGKAIRTTNFSTSLFNEIQKSCSFILPAMNVEEITVFGGKFDLLFPSNLDWRGDRFTRDNLDAERLFYLTLSHKQFRLPLGFYQEKIKAINKLNLDDATKKHLYLILVESCTGTSPQFILKSPEHIDSQWKLFISNVLSLSNKIGSDKTNKTIEELCKLFDIPEIHLINKIIENVGTKTEETSQEGIQSIIWYLNRLSEGWDTRKAHQLINRKENTSLAHLWDMNVCFKYIYQPNYMNLVRVFDLVPALDYSKGEKPIAPGEGEVRFNKEFRQMLNGRNKDERSYLLAESILDKLSCLRLPKGKPYLTAEQFIQFSKTVVKEATKYQTDAIPICAPEFLSFRENNTEKSFETFYSDSEFIDRILREQFPGYVDESLLEFSELSTDDLTKLELTIKARVKDKSAQAIMKTILTELSFERYHKEGHSDLVDKLITLINNYSEEERSEFLLSIQNHLASGRLLSRESNRGYESRLDQLNELLQTVIDTGSIARFQFLIAEFENIPEPNNKNVMKKLSYTLKRLLGRMNEGLASNPHIQSTEQLLLCKEFISAHSANSLIQMQNKPKEATKNDETLFIEMIQAINKVSEKYPTHARALNSFFIHYYETMNKISGQEDPSSSIQRTTNICAQLSALNDPDLILSIIHTFVDRNNANLFSIQSLESLFTNCPKEKVADFFKILIGQANQNTESVNKDNIEAFLSLMTKENNNKPFAEALNICFSQMPLPSLSVFTDWWTTFQSDPTNSKQFIKEKYLDFLQQPFPRDEKNNGFIIEKALEQVKSKEMSNIASRYTDKFIEGFHERCTVLRKLPLSTLLSTLQSVKNNSDPSHLVATMAELLYRSTGQELNTTQYLALDALLSSGKNVTAEIDTGEGKTRIAMLLLACRASSGQTCDFVTSDMQLAETAYLSYNSFFKMLNIKSNLIRSESNIAEYQVGAIHFSDCGNLSLFRNKATAASQLDKTLDPNPAHRALLLDEADKTWFDLYDTSYNFSMPADKSLEDVDWVYTKLVQFFSEDGYKLNPEVMSYYYEDIARCTKKFREFVNTYGTRLQVAQLNNISDEQISRWHESAVTALSLKYQIDFVIEPNSRVKTNKGPKIASEALVVADNQVSRHSKFSNGVQQCLHARLNILRHKDLHEESSSLDKYVHDRCTQSFHIAPENQIITSSSSETFLSFYGEGNIYGMTGTAGTEKEQREVEEHFGIADDPNKKHFIKMPRQKQNLRADKPISIVPKNSDKIAFLVEHIILSQSKNQPILIFCENDREATLITEQLNKQLQKLPDELAKRISTTQINSTMPLSDQRTYLAKDGGKPGAVTISTGMLGRGKDILLHSIDSPKRNAAEYGLKTIDLSYPKYRELKQRLGRAARNGQPGETHIVLSEEELKTKYRLRYSERNLKLIESLLLKRQQFETDKNQLERRVKISLHEYLGQYQKAYFNTLLPLIKKNNIDVTEDQNTIWINLFNEMILMKQKALNDLMGIIHNPSFSVQKFSLITDELHVSLQLKWDDALKKLVQDPATQTKIRQLVNNSVHKVELQDWEKRRVHEIKNEQLRPFKDRIVIDEIKSNESVWVYLNRKLFEFAQWTSWDSLAKYLDASYHFSRPINDNEIEPLVYSPDELVADTSLESYSKMVDTLDTPNKTDEMGSSLAKSHTPEEPTHTDLFKQKVRREDQEFENKPNNAPEGPVGKNT